MPLGAIGIGNGWGVAVGPQIDDQVLVVYENGDASSGTIVARIFSVAQQAPAVPSGEIWALHETGSFVKLVTSGDIDVSTAGNLNATVTGNMTATVTGDMTATITGNASISAKLASIAASVSAAITAPAISLGASGQSLLSFVTSAMVAFFNAHTHTSTTAGTPTSAPNQTMGADQLTSTVKGG
jgi:phage baseplate assembly protein gpV